MTEEVSIVARGRRIAGWTDISVTLRAEGFPPSFAIGTTWHDEEQRDAVIAAAGDAVQVYIGDDLVITGYLDRDIHGGDGRYSSMTLLGRGKTQDLVDCSAEWPGGIIEGNALQIAQRLASAYGLQVVLANGGDPGEPVVGWALDYGERAAAIIQRVAQNAGLMAYEDNQGRLLLASLGSVRAASGVSYGENVETWSAEHTMDDRYSQVVCASFTSASFNALGGSDFFHTESDPNVPRHRRLNIMRSLVAEEQEQFTIRRAKWEVSRRAGRSTLAIATIDSWRDSAGALWTPNTLVPVKLPGLRAPDDHLCLSEVTFRRGADGTHADLVLMPKEAFLLEPISLQPLATAAFDPVSTP